MYVQYGWINNQTANCSNAFYDCPSIFCFIKLEVKSFAIQELISPLLITILNISTLVVVSLWYTEAGA